MKLCTAYNVKKIFSLATFARLWSQPIPFWQPPLLNRAYATAFYDVFSVFNMLLATCGR